MTIKNTTRSLLTALSIPLVMAQDQSSEELDPTLIWLTSVVTSISAGIAICACVYCVVCKDSSNSTRLDIENQGHEPIRSPGVSDHEATSDSETDEIGASSPDERDGESSSQDENENDIESENESERSTSSSMSAEDSDEEDDNFEIPFADRLKLINVKATDHLVFKHFLCPITLEVPTDIVWSSQDKHYYDRQSLDKWLETKSTSPCIPSMKLNRDLIFPVNHIKQLLEEVVVEEEKKFKPINQEKISADADRPLFRRSLGW